MATLTTVVCTYFEGGTYRNNPIIVEIPDEAAELIMKYWHERGIGNCVKAKFLASNQTGNCFMRDNENKDLAGLFEIPQEEIQEKEVFEQHFKDEEEDDE